MSDIGDDAAVIIELQNKVSLDNSRRDEPSGTANGECWFCEEYLPAGHRWCNAQCRDDWQREQG
jgi:hypothetical protein